MLKDLKKSEPAVGGWILAFVFLALIFPISCRANPNGDENGKTALADTVCGWIGPVNCSGDTGKIILSDSIYIQGQHSLGFCVYHVDSPDSGQADFKKSFGGIETADWIQVRYWADSITSTLNTSIRFVIKGNDTTWISPRRSGTLEGGFWNPCNAWPLLETGTYWPSGDSGPAPSRIDTLIIRISGYLYNEGSGPFIGQAEIFFDSLVFYYGYLDTVNDTLEMVYTDTIMVDGFGDETGIERQKPTPSDNPIKIYPNLVTDKLYITETEGNSLIDISVFDLTGRLMKKVKGYSPLEIAFKKTGIYFCLIKTNDRIIEQKITVIKR